MRLQIAEARVLYIKIWTTARLKSADMEGMLERE